MSTPAMRELLEVSEQPSSSSLLISSEESDKDNNTNQSSKEENSKPRKKPDFNYFKRLEQKISKPKMGFMHGNKQPKGALEKNAELGDDILSKVAGFLKTKPDPLAPIKSVTGKNDKNDKSSSVEIVPSSSDSLNPGLGLNLMNGGNASKKMSLAEIMAEPSTTTGDESGSDLKINDHNISPFGKSNLITEVDEVNDENDEDEDVEMTGSIVKDSKPENHMVFSDDSDYDDENENKLTPAQELEKRKAMFEALLGNLDPNDPRIQTFSDSDDSDSDDENESKNNDTVKDSTKDVNEESTTTKDETPRHVEMEIGLGMFDVNGTVPENLKTSEIVEVRDPGLLTEANSGNKQVGQKKDGIILPPFRRL